ncbi:molybdopterin synthase sulfur carrier subunit [Vibrio cionasavignyae]|uniref:molybdopterin synthase sulfur carrier subunit n=1 Tax=Vibrio cionasavignyae TaxID=2910252 RepID=UPI003D0E1871
MIKVLFFAQTRELLGTDSVELEGEFSSIEAVRAHLANQEGKWSLALESGKLLAARNQDIVAMTEAVIDGDEIAFFPPVTGG